MCPRMDCRKIFDSERLFTNHFHIHVIGEGCAFLFFKNLNRFSLTRVPSVACSAAITARRSLTHKRRCKFTTAPSMRSVPSLDVWQRKSVSYSYTCWMRDIATHSLFSVDEVDVVKTPLKLGIENAAPIGRGLRRSKTFNGRK